MPGKEMCERILTPENRPNAAIFVEHITLWLQNQNPLRHTRRPKLAGIALMFSNRILRSVGGHAVVSD